PQRVCRLSRSIHRWIPPWLPGLCQPPSPCKAIWTPWHWSQAAPRWRRRQTQSYMPCMAVRSCSISGMGSCHKHQPSMWPVWWSWYVRPRVAVVLFNLGGPDRPESIKPFLLNLFSDPAILRGPFFVRPFLARAITRARLPPARANYALLGGRSPLLELTR